MSPDRHISQWESSPLTAGEFYQDFERSRNVFKAPLTACYRGLTRTEVPTGKVLCLGIGTAQVEEMAGLDQRRIVGVDLKSSLLRRAHARFPRARFHQGAIQEVVPTLGHFDAALSSDALDCIYPPELGSILREVRKKVGKLVAVQFFRPDAEFYYSYSPLEDAGSEGGPGIEGWSETQIQMVTETLQEGGIAQPLSSPYRLLDEVQLFTEKKLGGKFSTNFCQALEAVRYPLPSFDHGNNTPYPAQISNFLQSLYTNLEVFRFAAALGSFSSDEGYSTHLARHTLRCWADLFLGTIHMEYYFTILEQACREAGFDEVHRRDIFASSNNLVAPSVIVSNINRALDYIYTPTKKRATYPDIVPSGAFINSGGMRFHEPSRQSFLDAGIKYLVAQ